MRATAEPVLFHPSRPGLVAPSHLDPAGLAGPTRDQAKGPHWRRTSRGLYVQADVSRPVEQRIVEAAAVLPSYGGVTGWAALRWLGAQWLDGLLRDGRTERPVTLATAENDIRPQPGIRVCAEGLDPTDLRTVDGLRITSGARSVLFEMRYARDVREATVAIEMAACHDVVSLEEASRYAAGLSHWTGIPQARLALACADENSWSPWETRLRLIWEFDASLPRPKANLPLFDLAGNHIGTPDLFDAEAGLVGEYDGGLHLAGRQRRKDVAREARFRDHRLEYFSVVGGDMWDPDLVVRRIRSARARAHFLRPDLRTWTTEPPPWWTSLRTVEARRGWRIRADPQLG